MAYFHKRYHPPGTSPGTLIDSGEVPPAAKIRLVTFNSHDYFERGDVDPETCCLRSEPGEHIAADRDRLAWIHVQGPVSGSLLARLGQVFNLHPLAVEDVLNTGQRPKYDCFEDQLFTTLNVPHFQEKLPRATQISLFLGKRFVITFSPNTDDPFAPVLRSLRKENTRIRTLGIDYLFYSLVDVIIDMGFPLIESFGNAVEALEEETLYDASNQTALRIHELRRELLLTKKMLWPHRELLNGLMHDDNELIGDQARLYLRDCYDHSIQLMDLLETYRDMTTGILDVLSDQHQQPNERGDEGADGHSHDLHTLDLYCRRLWHEFRRQQGQPLGHARTGLVLRLSAGSGRDGCDRDRDAGLFQAQGLVLRGTANVTSRVSPGSRSGRPGGKAGRCAHRT